MLKTLLRSGALALAMTAFAAAPAEAQSVIKMTTQAPAGTELRIQPDFMSDVTVSGVDPSDYYGMYVSKGPGTEITIEGKLDQLEVYGCQLSELNVEAAPTMYILKCYNNSLKSLDVSNATKLSVLDCHSNELPTIDVSALAELEQFNASDNKLVSATFGANSSLYELNLSSNELVGIDLSTLSGLQDLYIQNNKLAALDLSKNTKLGWMYVFGNQLAGEAMDNFTSTLPTGASAVSMLYIVNTRDEQEGNVCLVKNVMQMRDRNWVSMDYLGGAGDDTMTGTFYYGADYVPVVSELAIKLTTTRKAGETVKLTLKASGDVTIDGVSETGPFTGTNTFTLTGSELTVKGNVTEFDCSSNDITGLTFVGTPTYLRSLDCYDNRLTSLDVVGATALTQVHAQNNVLESFNLEGCTSLMRVDCYSNALLGNNMKRFMQSLPESTAEPYLFVIDTKDADEQNVASTNDVAIATGKGWKVFDFIGGDRWGMGQAYEGSEPVEPGIPEEYFTFVRDSGDADVMLQVLFADSDYYPVVENAEVIGWNGSALTLRMTPGEVITVYGDAVEILAPFCQIVSFDASNCPNLVTLNLGLDEITSIDLSKNAKLENLSIECNYLTALDLSGCSALDYVIAYGNKIKGESMTALMSTLPERQSVPGQIIIYDGNYNRENNECLVSDVEAAKERNWITYQLDADMNPVLYPGMAGVESIEVSQAPAEYFTLEGIRVDKPANGIYIERRGTSVRKVYVR